jgi:alginate O-acetyltransferase complex protein AlgI
MLFDTPVYLLFLTLIVLVYWRLRWRRQNWLLLGASYFFYGWWDWRFLSLILISTVVDFFCARYIAASSEAGRRRTLLTISLVLNFGFLGVFKYFNFFADSFAVLLSSMGIDNVPRSLLHVVLPPGISFYTFQAVAYIVDVYHRKLEPADSIVDYALFISLFPHLIAGPIQRPSHLLPQVQTFRVFDNERFFSGIMLFLSGLFRKCVIADNCALLADAAFSGRLGETNVFTVMIGIYAFAWQIYGDFSGYSDMARGSAQMLGFHFMVNFRQPYLSRGLSEFWRRWHISLSTWLRDYLYIPLGGNRHGEAKTHRNLMLTMLLGGLWHGANWTFVIWGGIHGVGLAIERFLGRVFQRDETAAEDRVASIFSLRVWLVRIAIFHLVCFAWIFFRAQSVQEAFHQIASLGTFAWRPEYLAAFTFLAVFTVPMLLLDVALEIRDEEYLFEKRPVVERYAVAGAFSIIALLFSANQVNAFIYFQF